MNTTDLVIDQTVLDLITRQFVKPAKSKRKKTKAQRKAEEHQTQIENASKG